jgi:hypothetical protein
MSSQPYDVIVRGSGPITLTGNNVPVSDSSVFVTGGGTLIVNGTLQFTRAEVGVFDPDTGLIGSGTVGGTGTIITSGTIRIGSASQATGIIRGDSGSGTGTLTINGGLNPFGGNNRGRIAVQITTDTHGGITDQSNLLQTSSTFRLNVFDGAVGVQLLNDAGLQPGQTYSVELITNQTGQFERNAVPVSSYPASDFHLFGDSGLWTYTNVTPILANNTLSLQFQVVPVPEPAGMLTLAALGAIALRNRRRSTQIFSQSNEA